MQKKDPEGFKKLIAYLFIKNSVSVRRGWFRLNDTLQGSAARAIVTSRTVLPLGPLPVRPA